MRDEKLLLSGGFDHFSDANDVAGFLGNKTNSQRLRVSDNVKHSSVSDVDFNRAQALHFNRRIQMNSKGWNILKCDASHFGILDFSFDFDETRWRVELKAHDAASYGNDAGFEQHGDDANGVRTGHRRILDLLHDDEAGVRVGMGGRQN